ncbi:hypothetical protein BDAP_001136 [Binucleata daphniae]
MLELLSNLFVKKEKMNNTREENMAQNNNLEILLNYLQPQYRTPEMLNKMSNETENGYERSKTASVEAMDFVCYDYKLENENIHVVCDDDFCKEEFISKYLKYKDMQNISFQAKMNKQMRKYAKAFVIVRKNEKLYIYQKGFDAVTFDNKIENRLIIDSEFYIYKTEKREFDYFLTKNHRILYTNTYKNDINIKPSGKVYQEGYFAFIYIRNKSIASENNVKNIKEFDQLRYKIYRSFAFYDGELVANFYDYSIYKFEEAFSALHWATHVSNTLSNQKIIINNQEEEVNYTIGIAYGPYSEYDEYKGGRRSYAGVGLNKASRLGKLTGETGVYFCKTVFDRCKEMFCYLNLTPKAVMYKVLKGFADTEQIFCI